MPLSRLIIFNLVSRFFSSLFLLRHLYVFAFLVLVTAVQAQLKLTRNSNPELLRYAALHPEWNKPTALNKWNKRDTLSLPFFDDFVSTKVYPDSNRWFNNTVYINSDFPVNPPSYGVATFDDLNAAGKPYQELNGLSMGACDTLLSLPVNLRDSSGRLYRISDSIYFSFFFQRQGRGDPSDDKTDSLILQFKDTGGHWITQWKVRGGLLSPFAFVMFAVQQTGFLHKGFQFRFINFSRHTGNLNQWHIDYVHLAANRRKTNPFYNDFALQDKPSSLLKHHYQMPYDHYMADPSGQKADTIFIHASNLSASILNLEARHVESHNGSILVSTNFVSNAANVPAGGFAKRRFNTYNFEGLSSKSVTIRREYELRESGISSKYTANDKLVCYQEFNSCYAYDDGTAEYGFGYDDDVVDPFYQGAIAYRFNLAKSDTLWGIGMFFNRSVKTTAAFRFDLKVWQRISPVGKGRNEDVSLYTGADLLPVFTDSINGYHVFYLDTPLLLPKGPFYIGWEQTGNNHMDVGYDINNGYHDQSEASDNLFWADRGNWFQVDNFKGALMMRPYVGRRQILGPAGVKNTRAMEVKVYPNPFKESIHVQTDLPFTLIELFNARGERLKTSTSAEIPAEDLPEGMYFIRIHGNNGTTYSQKMLKL